MFSRITMIRNIRAMRLVHYVLLVLVFAIVFAGCTKVEKYPNGNIKYKGEWKDGKANGNGYEFFEDEKTKYEGEFRNGLYENSGKLYQEFMGNHFIYYIGQFASGKFSGIGTLYDMNGEILYEGQFQAGRKSGQGISYSNGKKEKEGIFDNDDLIKGSMYNDKGIKVSEGTYKNSVLFSGIKYNEKGKKVCEGKFSGNGDLEGQGVLSADDGFTYKGIFKEGKLIEGSIYEKDIVVANTRNGVSEPSDNLVQILRNNINEMYQLLTKDIKKGQLSEIKRIVQVDSNAWRSLDDFTKDDREEVTVWQRETSFVSIINKHIHDVSFEDDINTVILQSETRTEQECQQSETDYRFYYTFKKNVDDWMIVDIEIENLTPFNGGVDYTD